MNPFGTDETDIDIKRLLKTHIQVYRHLYLNDFHIEFHVLVLWQDSLRLTRLYTQNLEDFFGTMVSVTLNPLREIL